MDSHFPLLLLLYNGLATLDSLVPNLTSFSFLN
nr:MAG TPA: hypothetical protein [Caudoviricetes sp.]